jgi:hypothetical protein
MRKRIALLLTALMLALTMVAGPVASGALADAPRLNGGDDKCRTDTDHRHCVNNKDGGVVTNHGGQQAETNNPND